MTALYIFDLDGTLSDASHRQPILDNKDDPHRWDKFYDACEHDLPRKGVVSLFQHLVNKHDCWIWSGRSDRVALQTDQWLSRYGVRPHQLRMRPHGDNTPDDLLKRAWFESLAAEDAARLVATFDDRDRMVRMWRSLGVQCFQANYGDF